MDRFGTKRGGFRARPGGTDIARPTAATAAQRPSGGIPSRGDWKRPSGMPDLSSQNETGAVMACDRPAPGRADMGGSSANRSWSAALRLLAAAVCLLSGISSDADSVRVTTGVDRQAKLPYWQVSDSGMSLRLVQRLPDQTRAFFMARGFTPPQAEVIARHCVFQTVFKNVSTGAASSPLSYDLQEWAVHYHGRQRSMVTRQDWPQMWHGRAPTQAAQIALNWALLPTRQRYQPGDYNWGMSVFGLKPGAKFDLQVVWHQYGKTRTARIKEIQCAPDLHPAPARQ